MERLHKLLFELSSVERIEIMHELKKGGLKLSHLSRKLDLTVTETSRHLQRLNKYRLTQKDADGLYRLTHFGGLVLTQLSGLDVVSKQQEYFMEYDSSRLPLEFIHRIGELDEGELGTEPFKNVERVEKMLQESSEFLWILSNQILAVLIPTIKKKLSTAFDLRGILPKAVMPTEDSTAPIPSTAPGVQKRVLENVDVIIVVTEKEAHFCLPNRSGKIDYVGFSGKDPKFRKWCKDLFLYYWAKAKPLSSG